MIHFRFQDKGLSFRCQNMKCSKPLKWNTFWIWSFKGEDFCSYNCRVTRINAWKLRYMYNSGSGFLGKDWTCIFRTLVYKLNLWLNPLEWLKRW